MKETYREDVQKTYEKNKQKSKETNPRLKLKYSSMKFTVITRFLDSIVGGNFFVDRMPRKILYPLVKYAALFEFVVQTMFKENRVHSIFKGKTKSVNIQRICDSAFNETTRSLEKSLRRIVKRHSKDIEEMETITEKSRRLLLRGL
jgi:hypothetical protein